MEDFDRLDASPADCSSGTEHFGMRCVNQEALQRRHTTALTECLQHVLMNASWIQIAKCKCFKALL
jgi:hypothetical protein